MRISDVISELAEFKAEHGDLRVGFTGHYGEFFELSGNGISQCEVDEEFPFTKIKKEKVVAIDVPPIGEEPD